MCRGHTLTGRERRGCQSVEGKSRDSCQHEHKDKKGLDVPNPEPASISMGCISRKVRKMLPTKDRNLMDYLEAANL